MNAEKTNYVPALGFHFLTPLYDAVVRATTRERLFKRALIEQANVQPGYRVLDMACGTGTLSIHTKKSQPQAEVIGVDGDPDILTIAKRKARAADVEVSFEHGLSTALPFPDSHFDSVLTSLFLHHLGWKDKEYTAHELLRVLKPGGEIHVADWGKPANTLMRALYLPVQWLDGFSNTEDNAQGKLMPMFAVAGFEHVRERAYFNTPLGTMRLFSAAKPLPQTMESLHP